MATLMTVDVERLAHTGEGVATHDGRTMLVRGALPGERVKAEVVHDGKVLRAQVREILTSSPDRVEAPCPHVSRCGGCDLMHASAPMQTKSRVSAVLELLNAVRDDVPRSLEEAHDLQPIVHSPGPALEYRARARLVVHANGAQVQVGYHRARSRKMAAIDACIALRPELQPVVKWLETLVAGSRGTGDAHVTLGGEQGICVELRWDGRLQPGVFARADAAVHREQIRGIRLWEGKAQLPASFGDARGLVTGADGEALWIPPGGFAQASEAGGRLLAERVGALTGMRPGGLTIELFAGSGTLTVTALPHAERYIAVEKDDNAVLMLRENLAAREMKAKVVTADADDYALKRPVATVLLDPPRSGAASACAHIATARPRQIIYVSCNPATLARDLKSFTDYRIEQLEIVELFPQTSHVETIVRLTRR